MSQEQEKDRKYLAFTLAGQEYATDITLVKEIRGLERVAPLPESPDYLLGVMDLRGRVAPVVDLRRRFHLPTSQESDGDTIIVVVDLPGQTVGLTVDQVTEVLSLAPSAWEPPPPLFNGPARNFVSGVANLNSRLVILLDLSRVLNPEEVAEIGELAASA